MDLGNVRWQLLTAQREITLYIFPNERPWHQNGIMQGTEPESHSASRSSYQFARNTEKHIELHQEYQSAKPGCENSTGQMPQVFNR